MDGEFAPGTSALDPPTQELRQLGSLLIPRSGTAAGGCPAPSLPLPPGAGARSMFGAYEILAELGRGGMGVVYKARHTTTGEVVALKMLLLGCSSGRDEVVRFRAEMETASRLKHAGIVSVHEVGEVDGCAYYAMEYVEGSTLHHRLQSGPLPGPLAARHVSAIARAIAHAHEHGVLHRDLKPSNILINPRGEPRVADFGLAKRLEAAGGQTRTGDIVGTASYMAPEQALGKNREVGPAADVYGLGALLYHLLTGRPPFQADTAMGTVLQVIESEPAPPRLLSPKLDRDLETICLKCLEKAPEDRYASATALADDLDRYLCGSPISARSVNMFARLKRALGHSHHDVEFTGWGTRILWLAAVVGGAQLLIFLLTLDWSPHFRTCVLGTRLVQFALMGLVVAAGRRRLPRSPSEQQLWATWTAFLAACVLMAIVGHGGIGPAKTADELALYPPWAVLSGLALVSLGGTYWGRCYGFGLAFFALAAAMAFDLHLAPLAFGLLWAVVLIATGMHLRYLGQEASGI